MTDKEKLLMGLKFISEACHSDTIVEQYHVYDGRVTFLLAEGYEREPLLIDFDQNGNFVKRV